MKNNFKLILLCIAAGSILAGFIFSKQIMVTNHTINMTRDGFTPDNIVIAAGDSITWKNKDTRFRWPASNSHPEHAEYDPEKIGCVDGALDSCKGLKKGESYSFKFEKKGNWGIHDHLLPGDTMSIGVVSKSFLLANFFIKDQTASDFDSTKLPLGKEFKKLEYTKKRQLMISLAKADPVKTWGYLKKAALKNGEVTDNVHEFSHTIGREIYRQFGFNGIKNCSSEFGFGCFHGVTEQALLTSGKSSLVKIEKECLKLYPPKSQKPPKDPGCIHGMGHGVLTWNNLDLSMSLKDCDTLSPNYRSFCWDGVFMEYSMSDTVSSSKNDPWRLCRNVAAKYQTKCASYLVEITTNLSSLNAKSTSEMCIKAPEKQLAQLCNFRIGTNVGQNALGKLDIILRECQTIVDETAKEDCLVGATQVVIFQKYPNWKTVSQAICINVAEDHRYRCENYDEE